MGKGCLFNQGYKGAKTTEHLFRCKYIYIYLTDLTSFTKINSKWIRNLNVKQKTIKLIEDNIENLGDLVFSNEFLYSSRSMKERKWT